MVAYRRVVHAATGQELVSRARWCDSFGSKLRGFMLQRSLSAGEGLVLVQPAESRVNSAIHMLFVFFDLGVVWVDDTGRVVDTVLARRWRLHYAPRLPARYVVEAEPAILSKIQVGELIRFE